MTPIDPDNPNAVFDRLVDGELSATERQQLLASLDDRTTWGSDGGWRPCALAFLEAQAWGHQFKQIVAEPAKPVAPILERPQASQPSVHWGRWLAIAASLLVAFSLGWSAKSTPSDIAPSFAVAEQEEMPLRDELPPALLSDDALSDDAVTLLVRDVSGQNRRLQVPLMDVEHFDDRYAETLPAEMRELIREQGYNVQRRRRFAPMFFEQNEQLVPMVVPVDDTRIVPVSRPVF